MLEAPGSLPEATLQVSDPTGVGFIPNPGVKSRFTLEPAQAPLRPYASGLDAAGFYRPLTTGFRISPQFLTSDILTPLPGFNPSVSSYAPLR